MNDIEKKLTLKSKLILIDGNAILHRAYHAFPRTLMTANGELTNATYGFAATLLHTFRQLKPTHVIVTFDAKGPTFRHQQFEGYKASRPKMDEELVGQLQRVKEVVDAFNIPRYELQGFEADDLLGTIATKVVSQNPQSEIVIVTGDKDSLQLLTEQVRVFFPSRGRIPEKLMDAPAFRQEYGFEPKQLIDFKALAGDSSDEIPGVAGIGPKTATDLIKTYGEVEQIYKHLIQIKETVRQRLIRDKETAFLSKQLATIHTRVPLEIEVERCRLTNYDKEKVVDLFLELEFGSLVRRLPTDNFETMVETTITDTPNVEKKPDKMAQDQISLF